MIVGVDGCKAGWIAVSAATSLMGEPGPISAVVFPDFEALVRAFRPSGNEDVTIVVDMPIGLPEHVGRGPETLARTKLGARQSSVFSIPSRSAIYAEPDIRPTDADWYAAHRRASAIARATSDPPRAISIQAFALFDKIRQIDRLLVAQPQLRAHIFESHPELAFWKLNNGAAMSLPKKIKGRINPAGMDERKALLQHCGADAGFLNDAPPRGASADDYLDATAMMFIARRIRAGLARPMPDPPTRDGQDIAVAIWA